MGKCSSGWLDVRKPCWPWTGGNGLWKSCPGRAWSGRAYGTCGNATNRGGGQRSLMPPAADAPASFPPLPRVASERVACTAPQAYGGHVSRGDCRSLPQVVVEQAVVD